MGFSNRDLSWISLTTQWSSVPVLHNTVAGGEIYLYTYPGFVLYRYIATDGLTDAYYSDELITELIADRNYL